ncbi:MAG: hypothetical protein JW976_11460 [Syntrophaceae bacterium]|nr:hypothetical protein [Syntrophaceae bacterium]
MTNNYFDYDKLSKRPEGVLHKDFISAMDGLENINLEQLQNIVNFIFRQFGYWETEWAFSLEDNPNILAQDESEGWEQIIKTFKDLLVKKSPETIELISKAQNFILMKYLIKRRVEYNKTRPLERISTSILSNISFLSSKIGFKNIGLKLYRNSLYPKGTIGRSFAQ